MRLCLRPNAMVFGDLFNAMIDPDQEKAKKMPAHLPNFSTAAAHPDWV